jgi:hypothetical protein
MMPTFKQRLSKVELLAIKVGFRRALLQARRVLAVRFWGTLWAWAPVADAEHKWLDLDQLSETELALVAGPGFATYASTLDDDALYAQWQGGPAALRALGVATYADWVQQQPWASGPTEGADV